MIAEALSTTGFLLYCVVWLKWAGIITWGDFGLLGNTGSTLITLAVFVASKKADVILGLKTPRDWMRATLFVCGVVASLVGLYRYSVGYESSQFMPSLAAGLAAMKMCRWLYKPQ